MLILSTNEGSSRVSLRCAAPDCRSGLNADDTEYVGRLVPDCCEAAHNKGWRSNYRLSEDWCAKCAPKPVNVVRRATSHIVGWLARPTAAP